MRIAGRCPAARAAAGLAALLGLATGAAAAPGDDALRRLAAPAAGGEPVVRIGLDAGHRLLLSSEGPFRILDPASGAAVWRERYTGEVAVVAEGGPEQGAPVIYRVQVGAFATREAAEAELRRIESRVAVPVVIRQDADRGSWRVRVGEARDREALEDLVGELRAAGHDGAWIVEEPGAAVGEVRLRIVDASYEGLSTGAGRLLALPGSGGRLRVEGKPYRGAIELRITPFGTVRAINWVGLEAYLLGVVPAELGPEVWPQIEALKAQAVAARTYAWKNRGQFADEGFDLCATPRCQVYGGTSVEHPMSDRAVSETKGEILTFEGRPISSLYTATCGGHTEDGSEIFPEEKAPYLQGVPCRAEAHVLASLIVSLEGAPTVPLPAEDGRDVTRDWALLSAAGVLGEAPAGSDLLEAVRPEELRRLTRAVAALSGRPAPAGPPGPVDDLGKAAATVIADLAWSERAQVLLDDADLPALLRDPEAAALPSTERRALAYLALAEAVRPYPDGRFRVGKRPSVARLLPALARIGEAYQAFGLTDAVVAGKAGAEIRLQRGKSEVTLGIARRPFLFALAGGRTVPASRLDLWPGDRVRYRTDGRGLVDFLEQVPPVKGTSDDRAAVLYSWEVRRTRRDLEDAINRRLSLGRLQDLRVVRRGRSGRAVELEVTGEGGSTVVRGFDIRRLLGLRESLAVIEVQRDAEGGLEAVVFAGKGWGHGVGLCQVGAYGMALRGAGYREILAHYYRGARLEAGAGGEEPAAGGAGPGGAGAYIRP